MKRALSLLALFASVSAALPALAQAPVRTPQFRCHGTEPFWSMEINKTGIFYKDVAGTQLIFKSVTPRAAAGRQDEWLRVYDSYVLGDSDYSGKVIVRRGECSDHMSDGVFPYSVLLITADEVLAGCCSKIAE